MEGVALPQEGSGECRVADAPAAARGGEKTRALVTTVAPESPGIPARDGFNGFLRALPGDRALLPPSPSRSLASRELDASVGASGPHDFAVRKVTLSSAAQLTSIASLPNVRDDRETPLSYWAGMARMKGDLGQK